MLIPLILVLEAAVDGLDVGKDALPVWFSHHHHVLDVKQRRDAGEFAARYILNVRPQNISLFDPLKYQRLNGEIKYDTTTTQFPLFQMPRYNEIPGS